MNQDQTPDVSHAVSGAVQDRITSHGMCSIRQRRAPTTAGARTSHAVRIGPIVVGVPMNQIVPVPRTSTTKTRIAVGSASGRDQASAHYAAPRCVPLHRGLANSSCSTSSERGAVINAGPRVPGLPEARIGLDHMTFPTHICERKVTLRAMAWSAPYSALETYRGRGRCLRGPLSRSGYSSSG